MKKEKKRKSKKEKEQPENADSDENAVTKRRRESASSQGSVSPKPSAASRRRNSSVSSGPFEEGGQKKRRNSGAYDSSDSASSTSPYRGKKQAAYYPAVASFSGEASYRLVFGDLWLFKFIKQTLKAQLRNTTTTGNCRTAAAYRVFNCRTTIGHGANRIPTGTTTSTSSDIGSNSSRTKFDLVQRSNGSGSRFVSVSSCVKFKFQ